jgi:hypothetical protein
VPAPATVAVAYFVDLQDWLAVVTDVVTILVVLLGLVATRGRWLAWWLTRLRRQAIGRVGTSAIPRSAHRAHTREWLSGEPLTAESELQWLADVLLGANGDAALAYTLDPAQLKTIAGAYRRIAAKLGSRTLIGANNVPVIGEILRMADDVANLLSGLASRRTPETSDHASTARTLTVAHRGVEVVLHVTPDRRARTIARDLVVSYRRHLTAPDLPAAPWRDFIVRGGFHPLPASRVEIEALTTMFAGNQPFDGLLPRLVGWRLEIDPDSGRSRLHLSLAACSYSAVVLDHYPGPVVVAQTPVGVRHSQAMGIRNEFPDGPRVGLLALAMVPVTVDDELIFVKRSGLTGSHQGSFGPAISGNLELRERTGLAVDRDAFGVPDPLSALVREAREELGLVLDRDRVYATGLMTFSNPTERGTNLLTATSLLDQTLCDLVGAIHRADLIEGRWEVGATLLAAAIPQDADGLAQLVSWLINSEELTPHATAAGLASLMACRDIGEWASISAAPFNGRPTFVREEPVR